MNRIGPIPRRPHILKATKLSGLIHILLSRSVLLVYVFIGYLSILEHETPHLDSRAPAFSTNNKAFPSAISYPVALTEHSRSDRFTAPSDPLEATPELAWLPDQEGRPNIVFHALHYHRILIFQRPARAPPDEPTDILSIQ